MLIIFDLDYTLLDTKNFKTGLAKALGLAADEFNDSYKKYFKDRAMPYNVEKHIEYLGSGTVETGAARKERLKDFFLEIDKYLFADAENALKKLKLGGHKLLLLTFGDADWQKQKVDNLKIKKYFDEIIYTNKGKGEADELRELMCRMEETKTPLTPLCEKGGTEEILIVNDNAKECLEIKKSLGCGEIFLVDGPYADNCEHNLEIRKLEDIDKFFNR